MKRIDRTGKRYGKLEALEYLGKGKWMCLCDCGSKTEVSSCNLVSGHSRSCGCLRKENHLSHGQTRNGGTSKAYRSWSHLKGRCLYPNDPTYPRYGGRGIRVCDRWLNSFEAFHADMGDPPTPRHSIDRIDNDGDYTPENCRWATIAEQARNKRNNRMITYQGETLCMTDWADRVGISAKRLHSRLVAGWTVTDALTTPLYPNSARARSR